MTDLNTAPAQQVPIAGAQVANTDFFIPINIKNLHIVQAVYLLELKRRPPSRRSSKSDFFPISMRQDVDTSLKRKSHHLLLPLAPLCRPYRKQPR